MTIIDSQVHAYEANTPKRPWHSVPNWPDHVTGDEMVVAMNKVGVGRRDLHLGLFHVPLRRELCCGSATSPSRSVCDRQASRSRRTRGAVGIRIMTTKEAKREPNDPGLDRILRAAIKHDLPVNILCWGNMDAGHGVDRPPTQIARTHLHCCRTSVSAQMRLTR
jgi:L-fuconolactonase